jgi:hypothetical protein
MSERMSLNKLQPNKSLKLTAGEHVFLCEESHQQSL